MKKLNKDKVYVEFRDDVTSTEPIDDRHYTLTHSDETGDLFLTVGLKYAYDKINSMRDEVLGRWVKEDDEYLFRVDLYVDGQSGLKTLPIRNKIFRRELPLALQAIRYGDREFFNEHKELDEVPIIVHFNSAIPYYNRIENWGTFSQYK